MKMIEIIEKAIESEILITSLCLIPEKGASANEIDLEESFVNKKFSKYLRCFLEKWNGIDLDIIRIYRCGQSSNRLRRIADEQFNEVFTEGFIVIGSDPSGFIYLENERSEIYSLDTDGDEIEFQAENLDKFFTELVFGKDADKFLGENWKKELIDKKIIN